MADQRPIETPNGTPGTLTKEEIRAKKKARIAQVVDRGYVNDRLSATNIPNGMHGQWVRKDQMEIDRMRIYGYEIADPKTYGTSGMSDHGDGATITLGDVVLMVCSEEDHEIYEEVRKEKFAEKYVKKSQAQDDLKKNFKQIEDAGITLSDETGPAQRITNPKDI